MRGRAVASLGRVLGALAVLSAIALGWVALGWVPARAPEPPTRMALDLSRAQEPPVAAGSGESGESAAASAGAAAPTVHATFLPLCKEPGQGGRLWQLPWSSGRPALLVWCEGGFTLVDLELGEGAARATRLARFRSRAELPGGAAAGDFDGDGALDLVLGTTVPPQVVHRPGAGAFWVRGRPQGGFEPAFVLAEISVSALATVPREGKAASDLLLLTRGNLTAQRPGELWLFKGGPAMQRVASLPLGLAPRDLLVRRADGGLEAWVALGQPGALWRIPVGEIEKGPQAARQVLPLLGVQGFVQDARPDAPLLTRDARSVQRVTSGAAPSHEVWADSVNAGPGTLADLNGDGQYDLLAVVEDGLVRISGDSRAVEELPLPGKTLDVTSLHDASGREHALVLSVPEGSGELGLLVLPDARWGRDELVARPGEVRDSANFAQVTLE